jgi:hypothetical protein
VLSAQGNHADNLLSNSLTHCAGGRVPHSTVAFPTVNRNPKERSTATFAIASNPPTSGTPSICCHERKVIAETPHDRENAAMLWPLEAYAVNKAAFSEAEYLFAISLF